MRAEKLGFLSIFLASICCVVPVSLALLGLGGLGVGAFIGSNHWYFVGAAAVLLTAAWINFVKERRRCATERCEMTGGKIARVTLPAATVAVIGFAALNALSYSGSELPSPTLVSDAQAQVVIPVEGMTCFSCTEHVERSLKEIDGVNHVTASVPQKSVTVKYRKELVSIEQLVQAINRTGYQAKLPEG